MKRRAFLRAAMAATAAAVLPKMRRETVEIPDQVWSPAGDVTFDHLVVYKEGPQPFLTIKSIRRAREAIDLGGGIVRHVIMVVHPKTAGRARRLGLLREINDRQMWDGIEVVS